MESNQVITGPEHKISKSPISLDKELYKSEFQKEGTLTAQFRQVVVTDSLYPTKQVASDLQSNLFSVDDFGFEKKAFQNNEARIAWIDVPEGTTEEQIKQKLEKANANGATLYRILSNSPILTNHQKFSVQSGQRTLDYYANQQVVRYPEKHPQAGQLALTNGKPQYRRIFFWDSPMDDQDARTADPTDFYASPEILMEMQGATSFVGQSI